MKLIKFIRDYDQAIIVPENKPLFREGEKVVMNNSRASHFLKKAIDWDYFDKTGKLKWKPVWAVELKDLGRHFGRSKFVYERNGKSKVPMYERRYR